MIKKINNAGRKPKPVLTIAIDCGSLSPKEEKQKTGVYTVVKALIDALSKIDKRHKYLFFSFNKLNPELYQNFENRAKNIVLPRIGYQKIWLNKAAKFYKPKVFLAVSQALASPKIPTIGFIYDLAFLKFPSLYKNFQRINQNTKGLICHAKHIITISQASKNDIIKCFNVSDDFVSVVYPGIEKIFTPFGIKFVDTKPYFLYIGALKKTKNIPTVINAFSLFLKKFPKPYRLVLVGSDSDFDPDISKSIKDFGIGKSVLVKGYAQIHNLPKYYRGAVGFVSPSLYEGFGLPILEAMSCGVPVIAGNNSSLPEIIGKAGILVDVNNPQEICQALVDLATDPKLRQKFKTSGLKQAKKFSTNKFAKGILKKIDEVCKIK